MANKSLYVGNLSYSSNESTLATAFAPYGGTNVRIIEGRGFGFVDVAEDQMDAAIQAMNGKDLDGRNLTVNEAKPKGSGSDRRDTAYSGGSRGGRW